MAKISVAIATFNEEENIKDCLESVHQLADEIVVVDGSSADKTREIAKKMGAKVIKTTNKPMFHINKNIAIDACQGDWILQLDADERVTPELTKEIKAVVEKHKKGDPVAYWLKRKNYFLGKYLKKGGQYPDPVIRFFKKGKARLPEKSVHEQMQVEGRVGWLENDLIHWATPKFSRYLLHADRYTTLRAIEMVKEEVSLVNPLSWIRYLFWQPFLTFYRLYLRHGGFLDGWQGFVFALFSGWHYGWAFLKFLKIKIKGEKVDIRKYSKNWQ